VQGDSSSAAQRDRCNRYSSNGSDLCTVGVRMGTSSTTAARQVSAAVGDPNCRTAAAQWHWQQQQQRQLWRSPTATSTAAKSAAIAAAAAPHGSMTLVSPAVPAHQRCLLLAWLKLGGLQRQNATAVAQQVPAAAVPAPQQASIDSGCSSTTRQR
jgi:hypothetical protein